MEDDTKEFNKFVERLNRTVEQAKKQSENPNSYKEVYTEMKSLVSHEQAVLRDYKKEYDKLYWLTKRGEAKDKDKKQFKLLKNNYPQQQYIDSVIITEPKRFKKIYNLE